MTLRSPITGKQQEILRLIYRYRFLNRIQIQAFLGHKDYKTINMWLKDLRQNQYLERIYTNDFVGRTKPAIYYLGLNGVRYFMTLHNVDSDGMIEGTTYAPEQLRKRYKEATRSASYIERCLLLADCSLSFKRSEETSIQYHISTQADYAEYDHAYHFLTEGDLASQLGPQLVITQQKGKKVINTYLVEVFDTNIPRFRVKYRLRQYVTFLCEGDWGIARENERLPIVMLICPRTSDLIYAKRRARDLLTDAWYEETGRPHIRFATTENLRTSGMISKIWEEA